MATMIAFQGDGAVTVPSLSAQPSAIRSTSTSASHTGFLTSYFFSLLSPTFLLYALALLLPLAYYIHQDYHLFLSLGPGGTPSTVWGYIRISILRLWALRNPYLPAPIPVTLVPQQGFLDPQALTKRAGSRPKVRGIAPHRQVTQKGSPENFLALSAAIRSLAARYPTRLTLGTSCFEKHGTGLFTPTYVNRTCNGEVCHAHPSDGSLHLTLHPADAKVVLEKGWGERHPLARGGWCTRFVPVGFVMVYAPRSEEELEGVMEIVRAAVQWVSGAPLEPDDESMQEGTKETREVKGEEKGVGVEEIQGVRDCAVCVSA